MTDRKPMIPAVEEFVSKMRSVCAEGIEGEARWTACREFLAELLQDPQLQKHAEDWPVGGFDGKKVDNLLFYEDPDHDFVINALIKNPGGRAMIHDHGKTWTVYGLLKGRERIVRYEMKDDADGKRLEETWGDEFGPGEVDVVPPFEIHSEYAGEEKTVAVIIRSQRTGTFDQSGYEAGPDPVSIPGPHQVPYDLS